MDQFARHTGCPSLIIIPHFTWIHQHKNTAGAPQGTSPAVPLWGALVTPTKPGLKSHLPEAEAHFPGGALTFWNNPCSSQQ